MKARCWSLVIALLVLAGCYYDAPLTAEHPLPVDSTLPGVWQEIADDGTLLDESDRMVILKFSDTEYLVHYPARKEGGYYRAYPFKLEGVEGVQVQALGSGSGPIESAEEDIYIVVSYSILDGDLEIKILNTDLVDDDLSGSVAIREAFLKNRDADDLFVEPGRFRRVAEQD